MTAPEKQKIRIGLAFIDRNRCLPYALARHCIVCEEHCPTPVKAIRVREAEVVNVRGEKVTLKLPYVDAKLCVGCGICENKCPLTDHPGIRVQSTNESRGDYQAIPVAPDEIPLGEPAEVEDPYANSH